MLRICVKMFIWFFGGVEINMFFFIKIRFNLIGRFLYFGLVINWGLKNLDVEE